jgi:hypothetical protein
MPVCTGQSKTAGASAFRPESAFFHTEGSNSAALPALPLGYQPHRFGGRTFLQYLFQPHSLCDRGISIALRPKGKNLSFLFGGHKVTPPSGYTEKEGILSGCKGQKIAHQGELPSGLEL